MIVRVGDEAADAAVLVALGEDGDDRLDDLEPTRAVIGAGEGVVGVERVECEVVDVTGDGREGAIRQNQPSRDGGWRDTYLYAVLASEWRARAA